MWLDPPVRKMDVNAMHETKFHRRAMRGLPYLGLGAQTRLVDLESIWFKK